MSVNKEKLIDYLTKNWDVTFEQIIKEFKVSKKDFSNLNKLLEGLEKEGWIEKGLCTEHKQYEYNPVEKPV